MYSGLSISLCLLFIVKLIFLFYSIKFINKYLNIRLKIQQQQQPQPQQKK